MRQPSISSICAGCTASIQTNQLFHHAPHPNRPAAQRLQRQPGIGKHALIAFRHRYGEVTRTTDRRS